MKLELRSPVRLARAFLFAVICTPMVSVSIGNAEQSTPIVHTQSGVVQGVIDHDAVAFKGIPYAEPPIGPLRWTEPRPAASWQGARRGDAYGNACIQAPGLSEANGGAPGALSEDCLYLNIWTPKADSSARLPVMVWIHGGAYIFGSGSLSIYNGAPLARKGAVIVTLNYRLGALGFFAHPALESEAPGGPVNFALLDQIAALTWVQRNIQQFGGDGHNVTIFGQSAGAKSVLALVASPIARGLFQKAIAMSSYALPDATRAKATEVGANIATALGLPGVDATMAELRAVPAVKFGALKGQNLSTSPVPISGDKVLPESIQDTFAAGKEARVPLILGNSSDDSSVVVAFGVDPAEVIRKLGASHIFVKALYPGVRDQRELGRQVVRDLIFTMPVRWAADRHAKQATTWRYYFDYTAVNDRAKFPNGVPHGSEIVYALNTGDIFEGTRAVFTDRDRDYARTVSGYFFEFARSSNPVSPGAPHWINDRVGQDRTLDFGNTMILKPNFMKTRLNIFIGLVKMLGPMLAPKPGS
jgi:para-nitrobenzyl esterase